MTVENLPVQEKGLPGPFADEFDFIHEEADRIVSEVKKRLANPDENPHCFSLEMSVIQLHNAAEKESKKILWLFDPLLKTPASSHLSQNLKPLQFFIRAEDYNYNILSAVKWLVMQNGLIKTRNSIVHGEPYEITWTDVEIYVESVEHFLSLTKNATRGHWNELVIQKDLPTKTTEDIRDVLLAGLWKHRNEWVNCFFKDEDWHIYRGSRGTVNQAFEARGFHLPEERSKADFKPKLSSPEWDFVIGFRREKLKESSFEAYLVARFLIGDDLGTVSPTDFEPFLNKDTEVLLFIPEKLKKEFIERLGQIRSGIKFITYNYDQNGELVLNYSFLKQAKN